MKIFTNSRADCGTRSIQSLTTCPHLERSPSWGNRSGSSYEVPSSCATLVSVWTADWLLTLGDPRFCDLQCGSTEALIRIRSRKVLVVVPSFRRIRLTYSPRHSIQSVLTHIRGRCSSSLLKTCSQKRTPFYEGPYVLSISRKSLFMRSLCGMVRKRHSQAYAVACRGLSDRSMNNIRDKG